MKQKIFTFALLFCLSLTQACSKKNEPSPGAAPAQTQTTKAGDVPTAKDDKLKIEPKNVFTVATLDGGTFNSMDYLGKKLILAFFSYRHKDALPMLKALEQLKSEQISHQFRIFAVSIDYNQPDQVKKFIADNKIDLPVLIENSGLELASKFGIENEVALAGLDNSHALSFGIRQYGFANMPNGEKQFLDYMRENLAIRVIQGAKPHLGIYPMAPDFTAKTMDGKTIKLSDYRGKVVLLLFFSPKCPHCQAEIHYLRDSFYPDMKKDGFEIIAVSVFPLEGEMLEATTALKMPWPVIGDHGREIRALYSTELGVPENFYIDKTGRVRFTSTGYAPQLDNLIIMRVRKLLGVSNPPLLSDKQFNGVESCMICHEAEYVSWATTPHAHAFETLEIKGNEFNVDCVGCHSIGMNDPHGWKPVKNPQTGEQMARVPELFQNVQCEHCHGIGGIHKSQPLNKEELKKTCLQCHTDKFSLHFDFDERIHKVDHSNAKQIMQMSESERLALLQKVSKTPQDLFGKQVKYVGSQSCLGCHADVYKHWENSVHGKTTKNWLPEGVQVPMQEENKGVSCEACHGPGGTHIETKRKQDIRGLGEDCPFCVIEQICMSCHDARHDPDFNLATDLEKIKGHK